MIDPIPTGKPGETLVVRIADDQLDLRIFSLGGGPAQIPMPTKSGLSIPVAIRSALIAALVQHGGDQ